ncbi:MAG TPA: iron transporter [Acetobacteraceae bacterium]|nr:iron transporter [Acetobacteraceae bacterium]
MPSTPLNLFAAAAAAVAFAQAADAREYFVGGPVHQHDMEIVANYLTGIEMASMPPGMPMGSPRDADVIHLEADVHATADNVYGYPDGAWIPYLTIEYAMVKQGSNWKTNGRLLPMTAKGRTALRQQHRNERSRQIHNHVSVHSARCERVPAPHG